MTAPAWQRVLARSDWDPIDGCLLWSGPLTRRGYSVGSLHRVVYTALVGPIPTGWTIDHDCHTRALAAGTCLGGDSCLHRLCVNVDHLIAMTIGDNVRAGNGPAGQHARQVECLRGHPFDAVNTDWRPNGSRSCRTCNRDRARAYYLRRTVVARQAARQAARQVAPGAVWQQADLLDEGTS